MEKVNDFFSGRELFEDFGKLLLGKCEGGILGDDSFNRGLCVTLENGVFAGVGETVFESAAERDEIADIDLRELAVEANKRER